MSSKYLYVVTSSLDIEQSERDGKLRVIIGDAYDTDKRSKQYKSTRMLDVFHQWQLPVSLRDHSVHDTLRLPEYSDDVIWVDPDTNEDVHSREAFDFFVDPTSIREEKYQKVIDIITKAVESLGGSNVQRSEFIPTTWQVDLIRNVANDLQAGKKTILMDMAARFGKTGTSVLMFGYSSADVMVVTNYMNTVNSSFAKTVVKFFSDTMVYIEASGNNAPDVETIKNRIDEALSRGKKVVISCSLFHSHNLEAKIDMIRQYDNRMVFVDEADFGAHTKPQVAKVNLLREGVPLFLMSGTGVDKATSTHNIDAVHSTTYFDMLLQCDS